MPMAGMNHPTVRGAGLIGADFLLKTVRAEKFSFMLCDAFPAEVVGAGWTAGNGFPIRMDQTSLKSEFHRSQGGFEGRLSTSCASRISGSMVAIPWRKLRILSNGATRWV